jgi:V-type ATPase 116kDa subunit family
MPCCLVNVLTATLHYMQIKREKAVYHTLNKLSVDVTRKVLVGEAWVPASSRVRVQEAVRRVSEDSNSSVSRRDVQCSLRGPFKNHSALLLSSSKSLLQVSTIGTIGSC